MDDLCEKCPLKEGCSEEKHIICNIKYKVARCYGDGLSHAMDRICASLSEADVNAIGAKGLIECFFYAGLSMFRDLKFNPPTIISIFFSAFADVFKEHVKEVRVPNNPIENGMKN